MKAAIFTDTFLPQINGVTNTLVKMTEHFQKHDTDYIIFAPEHYSESFSDLKKVERFFSIKFFLYPECRISLPNLLRVKNTLQNYKPDVIHLMTEFSMGLTGLHYGKKYNIPTLSNYTTHFPKYLQYYNLQSFEKNAWDYMRWFHNQSQYTLCASSDTQNRLQQEGINRTAFFTRGVDTENFSPSLRSPYLRKELGAEDKMALLYVGRISAEKELDVLMQAYQMLLKKHHKKITLIVTGEGPALEHYKKAFGKQVLFTGYKKGKELSRIYASSDLFVFPSSTETFGNVVLEAMASGIPAVVPFAGGVKDIVSHEKDGLFFKSGSSEDLASQIEKLIMNPLLYKHLKEQARVAALKRGWDNVLNQLTDIYHSVSKKSMYEYKKIG